MGRARRSPQAEKNHFLRESQKLGEDDEKLLYLAELQQSQTPLSSKEQRALKRARTLVRGRGWPTERIEVFFPDQSHSDLPSVVGPTAVALPRSYCQDLGESEITRIIIHEMVHARSMALPDGRLPDEWYEDIGLYQLREGLTEIVAERIMPLTVRSDNELMRLTRQQTEKLLRLARLDIDFVERMSAEAMISLLSDRLGWDLKKISRWMQEKTGLAA